MNDDVLDDTMLEYRPISRKRMKMIYVEDYKELVKVLEEFINKEYFHWDEHETCWCNYCKTHWKDGLEVHTFECPIKRGRDILRNL